LLKTPGLSKTPSCAAGDYGSTFAKKQYAPHWACHANPQNPCWKSIQKRYFLAVYQRDKMLFTLIRAQFAK
jgi:hypothetical protein